MSKSPEKFARLLTEAVHKIRIHESKTIKKTIRIVQDELGYALGREGGSCIEYWRKGHIPVGIDSVEKLAHIGRLLGEELQELTAVDAANKTIESIRTLIASLKLPTRLREFDLQLDDMVDVVEIAHSFDMMNYLPRTVSTEDLYDIVKSAF